MDAALGFVTEGHLEGEGVHRDLRVCECDCECEGARAQGFEGM